MELEHLITETRNPNSMKIDRVSTLDMLKIINQEDQKVAEAIEKVISRIAEAIDKATLRYKNGGRIIYIGAGTSGRLGILDAVELLPTYNVLPERAIGLIAGGENAVFRAVEGAEDSQEAGIKDLKNINLSADDILIGLSASGRTPYVISALKYGRSVGALTIAISCNAQSEISKIAEVGIDVLVGPEVITGSTRMKAGTAQKMVLNMISSGIMIKVGKVYQNLMVNVLATNEKLVERGIRIIAEATNINRVVAEEYFQKASQKVNVAILMIELKISSEEAERLLTEEDGNIADTMRKWESEHVEN